MHSMPNTTELTEDPETVAQLEDAEGQHFATFGPPRKVARKPKLDAVLAEATQRALTGLREFYAAEEIGEYLGSTADDERVVTHRYAANLPGYRGWEFYATLARAPRSKIVTVCETGMLPGDNSILAPDWVPWRDRASEEERIRLDAIAAGEDPAKALEAAGFAPEPEPEATEDSVESAEEPAVADESARDVKKARRDAKRRRAKQQAARRKKKAAAKSREDKSTSNEE